MELRNASRGIQPGEFTDESKSRKYDPTEDPANYEDEYYMQRLQHSTHTSRSDYATALRRWLKYFPREQILILDYQDISRNPHQLIKAVCKHIGVSSSTLLVLQSLNVDDLKKRVNAATGPSSKYPINPSEPFERDFNNLLRELKYPWQL